ncbi:MAG: HEPN domain-containing protein [Chloroflexi bacterium]|nr:HEPN domain-containing protein [Chloroflexota bacterium]
MKNSRADAIRWLSQAEHDLEFARLALRESFFSDACFLSHQITEKSLKALGYYRGDRYVLGHSLVELLLNLVNTYPQLSALRITAGRLNQYYVSTRYPDALPGGTPFETYDEGQAQEAVEDAARFVELARSIIQ